MAENKKPVQQPGEEAERTLLEMLSDGKVDVKVGGKTYKIKSLKKGTRIKVSEIILSTQNKKEEETTDEVEESKFEGKVMAKIAAAYLLNSWWTLYFLGGIVWSIYWRWLYYIKEYTDADYIGLMLLCKKKAEKQTAAYTNNITLATDMKMTTMMMTRKEVKRILQERSGEQHGAAQSAAKEV